MPKLQHVCVCCTCMQYCSVGVCLWVHGHASPPTPPLSSHPSPPLPSPPQEAEVLAHKDKLRLLKTRKLTLVVDLDQTLIHTSTDPHIEPGLPVSRGEGDRGSVEGRRDGVWGVSLLQECQYISQN